MQVHGRDVFEIEKLHIFIGMDETGPAVDDQLGRHGLRVFFRIFLKAMAAGDPQGMRRRFWHGSSSGKEDVLLPHHHLPATAIGDKAQLIQRKCGPSQASHARCLPRQKLRRPFSRIAACHPDLPDRYPHHERERLIDILQIQNEYICLLYPFIGKDGIPLPDSGA